MTEPTDPHGEAWRQYAQLAASSASAVNFGASAVGYRARFASWLGAWKYVLILLALLIASAWLNVWQWKQAITAPLRGENASLKAAAATSAALLKDGQEREFHLIQAASAAATLLDGAKDDYNAAIALKPLTSPECAPGKARVSAVNRALGVRK